MVESRWLSWRGKAPLGLSTKNLLHLLRCLVQPQWYHEQGQSANSRLLGHFACLQQHVFELIVLHKDLNMSQNRVCVNPEPSPGKCWLSCCAIRPWGIISPWPADGKGNPSQSCDKTSYPWARRAWYSKSHRMLTKTNWIATIKSLERKREAQTCLMFLGDLSCIIVLTHEGRGV